MQVDLTKEEIEVVSNILNAAVKNVGLPIVSMELASVKDKFIAALKSSEDAKQEEAA